MEIGDLQSSHNKLEIYCRELKEKIPLNRDVLFIKTPLIDLDTFEPEVAKNRGYYAYPPRSLQCLASEALKRKLKPKILDLNYKLLKRVITHENFNYKNWISILEDFLKKNNPSIIGVSNLFHAYRKPFNEILEFLKNESKKRIIIIGGHNATYDGESLLEKDLCNFVLEREAENKINYLFDNLFENLGTKPTSGIAFKYDGKIERTNRAADIVDIKGNLIDTYKLIPIEDYCKVGSFNPYSRMIGKNIPFASFEFNRGCHGGCRFCGVVDYMTPGVRTRSIKDFLDELEYLNKERGIKHFELLDDDFARYRDRAIDALSGIIERKLDITWASGNGLIAGTINEELMEKMRDSGCIGFKIGVESGDPDVLKRIHKPGTLELFRIFSKMSQRFPEMFIVDNYIIGFPEETFRQMANSYYFSNEMNLDWSSFALYQHNVSFFGNKEERNSNIIKDFIPSKDTFKGKLITTEKIFEGPEIFNIPLDTIPSQEQIKHIWFVFNLLRNYIHNKNLKPGGKPEKFIAWTKAVQERYPSNAYMCFFLALANNLINHQKEAEYYYKKTKENLEDDYWKNRFNQFGFTEIMENFPINQTQSQEALEYLRRKHER